MPFVVIFVVLVAVVWGAVWAFHAISAAAGVIAAVIAALVALAILAAICAYFWLRWKETAPNARDGDWTHELKREWGEVKVAANKRLCEVRVGGESGAYIFADMKGARMESAALGAWQVAFDVKDAKHPHWILPISDKKEAHQWGRILQKAADEKL